MCPSRTSRFHFCITDHSPEIVPPPTMFLQVSAPKLIAGSSTFEKSVSSISNPVTDSRSASQTWVQILHVPRRPCFPCWCRGESNQSPLKTVTHLSWWREAGCPAQGDVLAQRNSGVGGTWREVQMSGQMKTVLFLLETFLSWEYLRSSHTVSRTHLLAKSRDTQQRSLEPMASSGTQERLLLAGGGAPGLRG